MFLGCPGKEGKGKEGKGLPKNSFFGGLKIGFIKTG
jgi:hypothetical protein